MRRHHHVVEVEKRQFAGRLVLEHVKTGPGQPFVPQRLVQVGFIDDGPARCSREKAVGFIKAKVLRLMRWVDSGVAGMCSVR